MMAGDLRHRVTLQFQSIARGSYGEETVTWTDLATIWAGIWPISAKEYFDADQRQSEVTHRIRIRYRSDVKPTRRFVKGNRTFEIETVINKDERNRQVDCMCIERVT